MTFDSSQFKRLERKGYNRIGERYLAAAESLSLKAVALGPGNSDVWLSRGLVLGATGRAEQAAEAFGRAASLDPTNVDAWFYAAAAAVQRGDGTRALESLARVRRLDPRRPGLAEVEAAARRAAAGTPATSPSRPASAAAGSVRLRLLKASTRGEADALRARLVKGEDLSALEQDLGAVRESTCASYIEMSSNALDCRWRSKRCDGFWWRWRRSS